MSSTDSNQAAASGIAALARVTVVVVTYHSAHCAAALGRCLSAFPNIIVVDNASSDDTKSQFARYLPHAVMLSNEHNLGFGAANNRGVCAARTEFVLLLNPDCVIDAQAVAQLVSCADAMPEAALVAPQLLGRHGKRDNSYAWTPGTWVARGPGAAGLACVGFASGACLLIRREAMLSIQGFDESFFLYNEDADLCLRLAQQCGPLILDPLAQVTHLSRSSSAGRWRLKAEYIRGYHHIQSKFLFGVKHHGVHVSVWGRWRYTLLAGFEILVRLIMFDFVRAARAMGRAVGACRYPEAIKIRLQAKC